MHRATADVADGIRWAADHGAHVINLSLGGPRNSSVLAEGDRLRARAGLGRRRRRRQHRRAACGYPGASDGVIGVSATDPDDKLAKFSSRGNGVDIAAPGVNVMQQTICNKGRDKCERFPAYNGTSMASPHVAGAAALLVEPRRHRSGRRSRARCKTRARRRRLRERQEALRRRHPPGRRRGRSA